MNDPVIFLPLNQNKNTLKTHLKSAASAKLVYSMFRILNEALGYQFGHQRRKNIKQKTKFEKEKEDLTGELEKQNQNNKDIYETIKYLIFTTRGIF